MKDEIRIRQAIELWRRAYEHQKREEYDEAVRLYQESITAYPTAEAHTFLGWTYSSLDRLDEAIAECHKAIALDPDFGNPYNDIGVYLMKKGQLDDAIPWLERAKTAPRYEPRHYPYVNLGRIYFQRNAWSEAERELSEAVRLAPSDQSTRKLLHEVWARLN